MLLAPRQIGRRQPPMELSGGNDSQTYSSGGVNYKSVTFTSSGTLTVANRGGSVDYISIGGGGGGGNNGMGEGGTCAGAGGAGGVYWNTGLGVSVGTYTITVGGGGAGASSGAGIYDMIGATGSANPYLMGGALLGGLGSA